MLAELLFLFFLVLVFLLVVRIGLAILRYLLANAVIGLIILWFTNWVGISNVPFTWLNVLVVAIGGVLGAITLIIISWF